MRDGLTPRGVYEHRLRELKQTLMDDDCYLPFNRREVPQLTRQATVRAQGVFSAPIAPEEVDAATCTDPEALRNGFDRPIDGAYNGCMFAKGGWVQYDFARPARIGRVRLVLDSDLNRETQPEQVRRLKRNMIHNRPLNWPDSYVPRTLVSAYRLEGVRGDGSLFTLVEVNDNHQRLRVHELDTCVSSLRLTLIDTWGREQCGIFSFDADVKR